MTLYSRITIALLAVIIFSAAYLYEHQISQKLPPEMSTSVLDWHGNELVLKFSGDTINWQSEQDEIPSNIRPLFFAKIPVNRASEELLMTIPGIGPRTAQQIITLRSQTTRIDTAEELMIIKGIGRKKVNFLKDYISFE